MRFINNTIFNYYRGAIIHEQVWVVNNALGRENA